MTRESDFISRRLTSEDINEFPLVHYVGAIHVVRNQRQLQSALRALRFEPILGFDTETRPSFQKGVIHSPALVQLATVGAVYLIQLKLVPMCEELARILSNPEQIKAGVAIHEDMRELATLMPFEPAGLCDLADVAEKNGIENRGLRSLVASFFRERISKGPQCSNWSLPNLSQRQIVYAATDAWMGRRIYVRMKELGLKGL